MICTINSVIVNHCLWALSVFQVIYSHSVIAVKWSMLGDIARVNNIRKRAVNIYNIKGKMKIANQNKVHNLFADRDV